MHQWLFSISLILVIFTVSGFIESIKATESYTNYLKSHAIKKNLHNHTQWLNLLYYRQNRFQDEILSEADGSAFFLSSSGKRDPQAELLATIDAIFLPGELGNKHPQCVFPARTSWLIRQLHISETDIPRPDCTLLGKWRADIAPTQISVVLPASYMNNPSSMFGHAFLKFEAVDNSQAKGLMAFTINFAADTSSNMGLFDYINKGLTGGFPSDNKVMRFYRMLKQYSDIENRDIWEFQLNFTQEEIDYLMLHVWELQDKHVFNYYFLDKNCAYRLIALLDVARPDLNLRNQFNLYTIPTDVIRALRKGGAIAKTDYRASALKTFLHHTENLDNNEKQWVKDVVTKETFLRNEQLNALLPGRAPLVLAIASEYLGIMINNDTLDRKASAELESKLFTERLKYNVPMQLEEVPSPALSPDLGHKGRRVAFNVGRNDDGNFLSLGYRELYHSFMDPLPGFDKGMEIELLNAELRKYENGDVKLQKMEIFNVASYSSMNTSFYPLSWRFRLGREERAFDYRRPVNYLEGDLGITVNIGPVMASGLVMLSLENSSVFNNNVGLGVGVNLELLYQGTMFSCRIGLQSKKYTDGEFGSIENFFGELSLPVSRNLAIVSTITTSHNNWKCFYENNIAIRYFF